MAHRGGKGNFATPLWDAELPSLPQGRACPKAARASRPRTLPRLRVHRKAIRAPKAARWPKTPRQPPMPLTEQSRSNHHGPRAPERPRPPSARPVPHVRPAIRRSAVYSGPPARTSLAPCRLWNSSCLTAEPASHQLVRARWAEPPPHIPPPCPTSFSTPVVSWSFTHTPAQPKRRAAAPTASALTPTRYSRDVRVTGVKAAYFLYLMGNFSVICVT